MKTRPLEERQAIEDDYDILLVDDISSFLNNHIVDELHRRGRRVLGVYDPEEFSPSGENSGRQRLLRIGVDSAIEAQASPEQFVRAIEALAPAPSERLHHSDLIADFLEDGPTTNGHSAINTGSMNEIQLPPGRPTGPRRRGHITAVLGASGGCGVTEIAIELARALAHRGERTVVVDGDEMAPSMAQRLNLPLHPNLRTAIDVVEHGTGRLSECLVGVSGKLEVLAGLPHPKDWVELRGTDVMAVVNELARGRPQIVVNASPFIEDLTAFGGADRFAISRAVVTLADVLIVVCPPSPMGVARLLDRVADLTSLAEGRPVHVIVARTPKNGFKKSEIQREIQRSVGATGVHFIPIDSHVERAAWEGTLVPSGDFTKAVGALTPIIPRTPVSPPGRRGAPNAGHFRSDGKER